MRLSAQVSGISEALKTAEVIASMAAMRTMSRATTDLKEELREQVIAAGLSERLAKTWQGVTYPQRGKPVLNPASFVFSKAPRIVSAYALGATIVATGGRRLLALPTDDTPRKRQGRALTPREVEQRFGRRLRFVPAKSAQGSRIAGRAVGFLLMDDVAPRKQSGRLRPATARELAGTSRNAGRAVRSAVMFTLQTSVKVPKKLDLAATANRVAATIPQILAEEWSAQ